MPTPARAGTNRLGTVRKPEVAARVAGTNFGTDFLSLKIKRNCEFWSGFFSIISFWVTSDKHISCQTYGLLQYLNDFKFRKFDEKLDYVGKQL